MEVHHQHLHNPHPHKEKLWVHYLLDFLMLFLAVSAGFFAENLREHFADDHRGKQYIESFYEDLEADTAEIADVIRFDEEKMQGLSNISSCYDSLSRNIHATSCLLPLLKSTIIGKPFQVNDRTLKQLDNAGGFRLLPDDDADSIMSYASHTNRIQEFQATLQQEAQDNVRSTYNLLIDFNANAQMLQLHPGQGKLIFYNDISSPLLFSEDRALLNKYFNELLLYYRVTIAEHTQLIELKKKQERLLEYFGNKYHFK